MPGSYNQYRSAWTKEEIENNPNRRGFIKVSSNNHTLEYADDTPFSIFQIKFLIL
jgi:hypothetical protein